MNISSDLHLKLKSMISGHRYRHSIGVQETAVKLAGQYGVDINKASVAGLVHDCAKGMDNDDLIRIAKEFCGVKINDIYRYQPQLLHGPVGAYIAKKEFLIDDEEIAQSIRCHTTGCSNMTLLDKIIYIADYIEPGRSFQGVDILREQTFKDINKGVLMALDNTINYVIQRGQLIDTSTIEARNSMIINYCLRYEGA